MSVDWRTNNTNEKIIGQEEAERYAKMLKEGFREAVEEEDVRTAMYNFPMLRTELGVHVRIRNERIVLNGGAALLIKSAHKPTSWCKNSLSHAHFFGDVYG